MDTMRYGLGDWKTRSAGDIFPVQSSVLDQRALLSLVVGGYAIPEPESCRFLSRGDADIYRVRAGGVNYYLKIYRPPVILEEAEAEARFVAALADAGAPVVRAVRRADGNYAHQVRAPEGERPMLLFEAAPPPLPETLDDALLSRTGEAVARMHAAADGLGTDFGIPVAQEGFSLQDAVYHTGQFLAAPDRADLEHIVDRLEAVLSQLPRWSPGFGLCHADLVLSNLRQGQGGEIVLFDFGNARRTWRSFELAVVYWSLGNRDRAQSEGLWAVFLSGYEGINPLPEHLSQELPLMLVLRQVGFLGGNCATLPHRLGIELFESDFLPNNMERLRAYAGRAGLLD